MRRSVLLVTFLSLVMVVSVAGLATADSCEAASSAASVASVKKIPILVYHHIRVTKPYHPSTWSYKMSVSPDVFGKQMQWIVDHGYTTVTLDMYVAIMKGEIQGPVKPVVITFDDNNRTQLTHALPILREKGLIGVFYLTTNRLQNKSFILASEVKQMSEWGMDIQSHTIDHATMTYLTLKRLDQQLTESKAVLEAITGKPVRHIAYPSTASNKTVRERAAKAGYTTGSIMDPRPASVKDDFFRLPRIMMIDTTNLTKVLP
ncbi:MAG: polysaccharide deacetylase family protein [Candidatus Peribacteraceae bacterium]|nr:polysaccharide deacetylase family protein [Candidatus Peribacteraceae bacterium]MBP9850111.1 polysaccharide deacetylase family protein [Candidatus Peribacteraceae bacterium]